MFLCKGAICSHLSYIMFKSNEFVGRLSSYKCTNFLLHKHNVLTTLKRLCIYIYILYVCVCLGVYM